MKVQIHKRGKKKDIHGWLLEQMIKISLPGTLEFWTLLVNIWYRRHKVGL